MELSGNNFIGSKEVKSGTRTFHAMNPATGEMLEPTFHQATPDEIDAAAKQADAAFKEYRHRSPMERAAFLNAIAVELEAAAPTQTTRITAETALPAARNAGEMAHTAGQMRMFAKLIEEGSWVDARIDHGDPARTPAPKPDLRRMLAPLGPVAVFGASNFPQAYSVAGGDTASALAAGCTVVVKAHPSHPGTSEMTLRAVLAAAKKSGMPGGVINMVHGIDPDVSIELVRHPLIKGVGFTGSLRAGRALMDAAAARPVPIPVYAEMGSTNPLFILPGAIRERGAKIAEGLKNSVTTGAGQFCTKPGLVFGMDEPATSTFVDQFRMLVSAVPPATMLSSRIAKAYHEGQVRLSQKIMQMTPPFEPFSATLGKPSVFIAPAGQFLADHSLSEEIFGPATLVVLARSVDELVAIAQRLDGQLTATIHASASEMKEHTALIDALTQRAGRLIFNGFPTGVEVNSSMQHGGPYPSTSDGRTTSVGTAAIQRFARPIAYQDWPDELLPAELQEANPKNVVRIVDGKWAPAN